MNNFSIPANPMNHALAATVHRRIDSDATYIAARAAWWRCLGYGVFTLLLGAAVGLAFFGYSYISDAQAAMGKLSAAIADGLSKAVLKGSVTLDTANGTVKLDTTDPVRIDPDSRVKVDGTIKLDGTPRPTERQMNLTARPPSQAEPVTNYTIFKSVTFADGEVVTGWVYQSSTDESPNHQYCYYSKKTGQQTSTRYNIASDAAMLAAGDDLPVTIEKAYSNCVWYTK